MLSEEAGEMFYGALKCQGRRWGRSRAGFEVYDKPIGCLPHDPSAIVCGLPKTRVEECFGRRHTLLWPCCRHDQGSRH